MEKKHEKKQKQVTVTVTSNSLLKLKEDIIYQY